ncbi:MAG TPA: DoxX family protein [Chitinophagaceae bacterium]|nr:DoxX family protein [Chitinophagaceae bacterium]
MKYIVLLGRILFSAMFLISAPHHFTSGVIGYASKYGVPAASFLVPFAGILALLGGISILLGYKAKLGAWLIVLFLIPVTFMMHAFWKETDPMQTQMQMINFMKNLSMLGGALLITYFGAGPLSFDARSKPA